LFWPEHSWGNEHGFFVGRDWVNLLEGTWIWTIEGKRQILGLGVSIVPQFSKILSYNLAILPFSGWPCSWIFDKNKCPLTSPQSSVGLFESAPLKASDYDKDRSKKTYVSNQFEWLENLTYFSPNNIAQFRFIFGTVIGVLGFAYALASFRQGWLLRFFLGNAFFFFGLSLASASTDRRSEHVGIEVVVIAELKLRDKQQHIFAAHLVRAEWSDDSVFNAEYRPKRTHRVTPGLTRWSIVTPGV
jgi:hypothetical protein